VVRFRGLVPIAYIGTRIIIIIEHRLRLHRAWTWLRILCGPYISCDDERLLSMFQISDFASVFQQLPPVPGRSLAAWVPAAADAVHIRVDFGLFHQMQKRETCKVRKSRNSCALIPCLNTVTVIIIRQHTQSGMGVQPYPCTVRLLSHLKYIILCRLPDKIKFR